MLLTLTFLKVSISQRPCPVRQDPLPSSSHGFVRRRWYQTRRSCLACPKAPWIPIRRHER